MFFENINFQKYEYQLNTDKKKTNSQIKILKSAPSQESANEHTKEVKK